MAPPAPTARRVLAACVLAVCARDDRSDRRHHSAAGAVRPGLVELRADHGKRRLEQRPRNHRLPRRWPGVDDRRRSANGPRRGHAWSSTSMPIRRIRIRSRPEGSPSSPRPAQEATRSSHSRAPARPAHRTSSSRSRRPGSRPSRCRTTCATSTVRRTTPCSPSRSSIASASTGNYTNLPAGFVADATTGPSLATLVTPVSVTLPAAAAGQAGRPDPHHHDGRGRQRRVGRHRRHQRHRLGHRRTDQSLPAPARRSRIRSTAARQRCSPWP